MRILIVLLLCLTLTGCTYSSCNMMRAQGKDVMVFGAWGYVHCQDSSVTFFRSTDAIGYMKKNAEYPKIPPRPIISETGEGGTVVIGKTKSTTTVVTAPATTTTTTPATTETNGTITVVPLKTGG